MSDISRQGEIDWRYRTVTTLAKEWKSPWTGKIHQKGTPVSKTTFIKHGEKELSIGDPSAPALYLNLAHKAYNRSVENHPIIKLESSSEIVTSEFTYDYFEDIMSSIVFSFTALEAFANEEIPEDYLYEHERKSGLFEIKDKDYVERHVSLNEKLGSIIPKIKKINSPKGSSIWQDYVLLKRKRDRIIHLKSSDRKTTSENELYPDSIWSQLLEPNQPRYPSIAFEMIEYFSENENHHWIQFSPLKD